MKAKNYISAGFATLILSTSAMASTIQWTLNNVQFNDGGSLVGTFTTESSNGAISNFNLTSSDGSTLRGFNYNGANSLSFFGSYYPNSYGVIAKDSSRYVYLSFDSLLTAPGTYNLRQGDFSYECPNCSPYRTVISGNVFAAAVPEPETYAMLMAGMGVMGAIVRRRKVKSL